MTALNTLTTTANLTDINATARQLGFEMQWDGEFYTLWQGEQFCGSAAEIAPVLETLNQAIEQFNEERAEQAERQQREAARMADWTDAALLNEFGTVIGSCRTGVRNGAYVELAAGFTDDGRAINFRDVKISRSQKNLKAAQGLPLASVRWVDDAPVYQLYED